MMKKRMVKVFSVVLGGAFLGMSLAACNKGGATSGGSIKISYFEGGTGSEWIEALAESFTNDTGIDVELDPDDQITNGAGTKLNAGRNLSDIMFIQYTNWREYVQQDWIVQMDDLYDGSFTYTASNGYKIDSTYSLAGTNVYSNKGAEATTATVYDMILNDFKDYGYVAPKAGEEKHFYVMPWHCPAVGIAYNETLLSQAGWEAPPATEAELRACIQDINTKLNGVSPFAWGGREAGYLDFVTFTWWAQYEGVDKQRAFYDFVSPEDSYQQEGREKALALWKDIFVKDGEYINSIDGAITMDHGQAQRSFANGNAVFVVSGAYLENEIAAQIEGKDFKFKMMAVPAIEGAKEEKVLNTEAGTFACIPKQAGNVEAAKAFLAYMHRPEWIEKFSQISGALRPFNYKPSTLSDISAYNKSAFTLFETSKLMLRCSDSLMYAYVNPSVWSKYNSSGIYGKLREGKTAVELCDEMYQYAVNNWSVWQKSYGEE